MSVKRNKRRCAFPLNRALQIVVMSAIVLLALYHVAPTHIYRGEQAPRQYQAAPTLANPVAWPNGYSASEHFEQRMVERGVSAVQAIDVIEHGQLYYDPKNDSQIRYKDGVFVAIAPDGVLKTVVRGDVSPHWLPR